MFVVYRIQDSSGRGPFKPGFSREWVDSEGPPPPPTWMQEFPGLLQQMTGPYHFGSAVRNADDICKWFTPTERARLKEFGYRLVSMKVDQVLAESPNQLVFARKKRLNKDVDYVDEA